MSVYYMHFLNNLSNIINLKIIILQWILLYSIISSYCRTGGKLFWYERSRDGLTLSARKISDPYCAGTFHKKKIHIAGKVRSGPQTRQSNTVWQNWHALLDLVLTTAKHVIVNHKNINMKNNKVK